MRFFSPSSKAVFGIMALAALMGCQSFSKQALEAAPRRSFAAEPVWIRSTGGEEHVGHPVPQLFVPIFFEDSVIAGNSYNNVSAYRKDSGALI